MQKVTMLLAYGPEAPEGNTAEGLELRVCLTPQGQLDEQAYGIDPNAWRGRRFRPHGPDRTVELVRLENGWALRRMETDDAPVWPIGAGMLRPGEYVTICPPAQPEQVFRIVSVESE